MSVTPEQHYQALLLKIEHFFADVQQRHPDQINCRDGCFRCCQTRFSVTAIEAEQVRRKLATLPDHQRQAMRERAGRDEPDHCPALTSEGGCGIYEARPVICRTHGLAIRFVIEKEGKRLPMVDACPLNFTSLDAAELPARLILDQTTLSTMLAAIDLAWSRERDEQPGRRFAIAALIADERV